jgi:hypothetical protein
VPTWGGILEELAEAQAQGNASPFDAVRRKYLVAGSAASGRNAVLYATAFTQPKQGVPPEFVSITDEDLQGLMEVFHGLEGDTLDLILHSPGGSIEAAEAIVTYTRTQFQHVRAVVPSLAMSAATMVACSCDEIVMGKHSFLGPIDPQVILATPLGQRSVAAQAILEQFDLAKKDCADPQKLAAWLPMLGQYGPDLLVQCKHFSDLSESLVREWLQRFMFAGDPDGATKAATAAQQLVSHDSSHSHGRHLSRDACEAMGLKVTHLEDDQALQDAYLSVFHAATHTFSATDAVKIIENQHGKAFIKQLRVVAVTAPGQPAAAPPPPA